MKYDISILNDYIERGLLEKNPHPSFPIDIYNYTRACQFEKKWDEITLNMRGTVLDREGNVVARSFPKFFNFEEHRLEDIPNEVFDVYTKYDGSLGILFHYDNDWHLATRGSFVSDQAKKGREMLEKYDYRGLNKGCTYLFEIVYDLNRIVVDYDYEDLILLAIIDNNDGHEYEIHSDWDQITEVKIYDFLKSKGFKIVEKHDGVKDFLDLKKMVGENQEGFIVRFKSGFRMKIKGEEYVRLHRILTNFSNVDIWECLKENTGLEKFLDRVPDEFDSWVKGIISDLKGKYSNIEESASDLYEKFLFERPEFNKESEKKEYALWVQEQPKNLQGILFSMYLGKDYSKSIWRMIRPEYQKPFWNSEK
jgi:RNA ligase